METVWKHFAHLKFTIASHSSWSNHFWNKFKNIRDIQTLSLGFIIFFKSSFDLILNLPLMKPSWPCRVLTELCVMCYVFHSPPNYLKWAALTPDRDKLTLYSQTRVRNCQDKGDGGWHRSRRVCKFVDYLYILCFILQTIFSHFLPNK